MFPPVNTFIFSNSSDKNMYETKEFLIIYLLSYMYNKL